MAVKNNIYCLDSNVLIQAWQKYYSPHICPDYWSVLDSLGQQDKIFLPDQVFEEITRTEDNLTNWLKTSHIPIRVIDQKVTKCLQKIYASNTSHKFLVDNIKGRSLADPWVIAHAINESATVVTKEEKITASNKKKNKIKIPDVCENMKIRCINDFKLIEELGIRFNCKIIN